MTELLTAARMRAIEQAAMDSGAVTGLELMERAGRGVVEAVFAQWPDLAAAPRRALVLCGPGNNGGDGFVIARLLHGWGWAVEVCLYGDPEKLPPDARANHDRWCALGPVTVHAIDPAPPQDDSLAVPERVDLLVDALFGTGLGRPFTGPFTVFAAPAVRAQLRADATRAVAVDLPSGLCSDSGRILGTALPADLTVTFHACKCGHWLGDGPALCGKTVVAGIGLDRTPPARAEDGVHAVGAPSARALSKGAEDHKYGHGHALVLSGPMGRSGAARLAARGALRVGAGLVTVGAPGAAMMECATQLTAIMLRRCDGAEGLAAALEDVRLTTLCLGPGLGIGAETRALVASALAAGRATVLDADALSAFAEAPDALFRDLHPHTVLTPHGGEFARLFPDIAEKLAAPATWGPAYSKVDATRAAAARAGCTVLYKGPDTVIASPDGRCAVNAAAYARAAPWLATAGSGDVLAGMITGLLARGLPPQEAAETGAWLHVEAARAFGPGLIAKDLPEMLPQVIRTLDTP
ncbi:NAD(P)H-hydrate dehydratase [Dinoroseobacter sp. PD6]|uniref:NAD(P)H-hydrate dehydratase n=1 Tax=Dinoroseobacter sp. PD6 TaxID=3028384 RepID=UPI00237A555D|nr:NAD(P)H-hydrate dehydratase [Dinoroseobacter sp. PD6]MDD9715320.1 NAD(P)H-hydrate dehydratase [Dinoroseobacter sp. PD6]